MSNRLCILSDAFLIDIFPLFSVVFARPYYGESLLGMVLAVVCDCVLLLFYICLPYNACISGDYQGVFQGSFG